LDSWHLFDWESEYPSIENPSNVFPDASGVSIQSARIVATSLRLIRPTATSPWLKIGLDPEGQLSFNPVGLKIQYETPSVCVHVQGEIVSLTKWKVQNLMRKI
jgi:hypothetical protein